MGFLRKATWVASGGASGLFIKANSKKERTAKASEKMLKLQQAEAGLERQKGERRLGVNPPPQGARTWAQVVADRDKAQPTEPAVTSVPLVADELAKLADLRDRGVITSSEFEAQKEKLLGA